MLEFCLEEARLPGLVRLGVLETLGVLRACDVNTLLSDCYITFRTIITLHFNQITYISRPVPLTSHCVWAHFPYFSAGTLPGQDPRTLGEAGVVRVVQGQLGGGG